MANEVEVVESVEKVDVGVFSICCAMDKIYSGIREKFSLHHDVGSGSGGGGSR